MSVRTPAEQVSLDGRLKTVDRMWYQYDLWAVMDAEPLIIVGAFTGTNEDEVVEAISLETGIKIQKLSMLEILSTQHATTLIYSNPDAAIYEPFTVTDGNGLHTDVSSRPR